MAEWISAIEPIAYGPLKLKPWELGRLTFGEFALLVEGYKWRSREDQIFTAGFVASVINCCSPNKLKRPVTVEALLGKEQKEKDPKTAQTEMQQLLATVG